jgi:threonine aldolase
MVDSMMFCLSKGLCSPAGSMLCGKTDFIARARRLRKRLGGGLRQAGVLASCGLVSLNEMTGRLKEDHESAKELAAKLVESGLLLTDLDKVETNILIFTPPSGKTWTATKFASAAKEEGVLVTTMGDRHIRLVTHNDYHREWIGETVDRIRKAVGKFA